jgi:ATP synthase protein I
LHAAVSATLGGAIGLAGGLVFAWLASRNRALTADGVLLAVLRAETVKVLVLFGLLAVVLVAYQDVVVGGLIGSFIGSILIFGLAFFVRDA